MPGGLRVGRVPAGAVAGRLVAIGVLFTAAVLLELGGRAPYSERALTALYALVLAGFLWTLGGALLAAAGRDRALWLLEVIADGVLLTGLVYATGGPSSVFGFLYVAWIIYAAVRAGTPGAAVAPVVAAAGYSAVAWGLATGWLPGLDYELPTPAEARAAIVPHTIAYVLVAVLAHRLAQQVKRGREELHELGEIHRRIFDNVSSGLLALDPQDRITSLNREAERITGYSHAEVRGWPIAKLLPELETFAPGERGDCALSRHQLEFTNRRGERLHLGLSRSLLRDANDQPEGSVLIFQDLTRVVRMEEELRRSERLAAVGQLAAGLAHEIRNPLASLSGSIQLLEREWRDPGRDARRLVGIVHRETERLNRLVTQFLGYARPGPARRGAVGLQALVDDIAELVETLDRADTPHVNLQVEVPAGLAVLGDPDQLRQVVWNLVLNAIEARPRDGAVHIRAEPLARADDEPAWIALDIRDSGEGMPVEVVERVREPFYTTKASGTGLGLATVHRVVEAHGGQLAIESEPSVGTHVRVVLPDAGDAPPADAPVKGD